MKLTATLSLNSTEPQAIPTGHQCTISHGDNTASCKIRLVGNAQLKLKPGQSGNAELLVSLSEGKPFRKLEPPAEVVVMQGMRAIGKATITRVSA